MSACATTAPPRRAPRRARRLRRRARSRRSLPTAPTSFPRLTGRHRGREVRVDLLCDTMTIRRLPQLWMSTTLLDRQRRSARLRHSRAPRRHRVLFAHLALRASPRDAGRLPRRGARSAATPAPSACSTSCARRSARHPRRPARQGDRRHAARPAHHPPGRRRQARRSSAAAPIGVRERRRAATRSRHACSINLQAIRAVTGAYGRARAA